jgi:hypothetical protein
VGIDQAATDTIAKRDSTLWLEVDRYDPDTNGIWTSEGRWLGTGFENVILREAVPVGDA